MVMTTWPILSVGAPVSFAVWDLSEARSSGKTARLAVMCLHVNQRVHVACNFNWSSSVLCFNVFLHATSSYSCEVTVPTVTPSVPTQCTYCTADMPMCRCCSCHAAWRSDDVWLIIGDVIWRHATSHDVTVTGRGGRGHDGKTGADRETHPGTERDLGAEDETHRTDATRTVRLSTFSSSFSFSYQFLSALIQQFDDDSILRHL